MIASIQKRTPTPPRSFFTVESSAWRKTPLHAEQITPRICMITPTPLIFSGAPAVAITMGPQQSTAMIA